MDSTQEICEVALRAAEASDGRASENDRSRILSQMMSVFPKGTQGSDGVVQAKILLEDVSSFDTMIRSSDWVAVKQAKLEEWGTSIEHLQEAFMAERKKWMDTDMPGWAKATPPFSGVKESLMYCEFPFYIVTSKPAASAAPVLTEILGLPIEEGSPRLFAGLEAPTMQKGEALREIASRPMCKDGARLHFVDDRFATLKGLREQASLDKWNLYLAEWGHNTRAEQDAAQSFGIKSLSLRDFSEMLKWGIIMGVDDGCEPTPEEVEAQVYQERKS